MDEKEEYMEIFGLTAEEMETAGEGPESLPTGGAESDGGGSKSPVPGGDGASGPEDPEEPDGGAGETGGGEETPESAPPGGGAELDIARRQAEQARVDQIYAEIFAGQVSPFTGQPIRTEADFLAWKQEKGRRDAEAFRQNAQQQLQQAGVPADALKLLIDQSVEAHPAVRQAQQITEQAALERARVVEQQAKTVIAESLKTITAEFPEVKSLDDIARMPTAGRFNALVQQGIGLEDAFFLANRESIVQKQRAAARQAAVTAAQSKAGLNAGIGKGANGQALEVPADMVEAYREMMPDASMDEIRTEYAKYLKAGGR